MPVRSRSQAGQEVRLTDAAFARKLAAVRCHASQLSSLERAWPDLLERDGPLACERHR